MNKYFDLFITNNERKNRFFNLFTTPSFIFFVIASPTSSSFPLIGAVSIYRYPRSIASLTACSIIPFPVSYHTKGNHFSSHFTGLMIFKLTPQPHVEKPSIGIFVPLLRTSFGILDAIYTNSLNSQKKTVRKRVDLSRVQLILKPSSHKYHHVELFI